MGQKSNLKLLEKIRKEKEGKQKEKNIFYLEKKKKINNLIKYYNYKYFIEKEQLESIADFAFCIIYKKYKNIKEESFNHIFIKATRNQIISLIRNRIKEEKLNKKLKENKIKNKQNIKPNFLSKEANEVIEIIYNAPFELFSCKNKITQETISKYLRKEKGLKFSEINIIFSEIKTFLREV